MEIDSFFGWVTFSKQLYDIEKQTSSLFVKKLFAHFNIFKNRVIKQLTRILTNLHSIVAFIVILRRFGSPNKIYLLEN